MPDWNVALAIITGIGAIVGAIGGLSGMAALYSARNARRKNDADALNATVVTLQAENVRLAKRSMALEEELDEERQRASEYHHTITALESENRFLRERIVNLEGGQD